MRIRTRLTLWFAAALWCLHVLVGFIGGFFPRESEHKRSPQGVWEYVLFQTREITFSVGLPAVVLGVIGGSWIIRRALAPVTALTKAMENTNDHNLNAPLSSSGNGDELDRMTIVFNAMTARLDQSIRRIREFSLHASHELKTPLAILRGELEMTLADDNLTPVQRERHMSQIAEVERLARIVDALTLLTKADTGRVDLNCENVQLDEMVREYVLDGQVLAQPHHIQVNITECSPTPMFGDRDRLRQLLLNLLDNAIKYNHPGGVVNVSLRSDSELAELRIENTGPGLAAELQPRVFDRFFRGDRSHSSTIEGCGLGLSIAEWIVTAHKGTIRFFSEPGKITVVAVTFPVADKSLASRPPSSQITSRAGTSPTHAEIPNRPS
jgi:signal transduction histidine kinase